MILPRRVRGVVENEHLRFEQLQEVRLRAGKPLICCYQGVERTIPSAYGQRFLVTQEDIHETMEYVSHYSLYAYENDMCQGFITIEGGHRVGMTGQVITRRRKGKESTQYFFD